jgi:hypothetical protein
MLCLVNEQLRLQGFLPTHASAVEAWWMNSQDSYQHMSRLVGNVCLVWLSEHGILNMITPKLFVLSTLWPGLTTFSSLVYYSQRVHAMFRALAVTIAFLGLLKQCALPTKSSVLFYFSNQPRCHRCKVSFNFIYGIMQYTMLKLWCCSFFFSNFPVWLVTSITSGQCWRHLVHNKSLTTCYVSCYGYRWG